ncbi:hypothetical protein ACFVW2_25660 [Streptomyces sp. NPDC058171]
MRDGLGTRLPPCIIAALLFALHLFTPTSPLATAHTSDGAVRPQSTATVGPRPGPVTPTATSAGPNAGRTAKAVPARVTRVAERPGAHDRLRHEHPVEEAVQILRARDRHRCEEYTPQRPPLLNHLGTTTPLPATPREPRDDRPSARLRPADRPATLQVFRC